MLTILKLILVCKQKNATVFCQYVVWKPQEKFF